MTDYDSLISRAVAGLHSNTAEARRVIYEAARKLVPDELRRAEPPLTESEVRRERLVLEQAIRKVKAEQLARRARNQ